MERYLACGNPDCKCARGERHVPVRYLSVALDQSRRLSSTGHASQVQRVRQWIENIENTDQDQNEEATFVNWGEKEAERCIHLSCILR